jgi:uncharacterized membrane protein
MEFKTILVLLHVAGGAVALIAGPFAMFNQDGGRLHRNAGSLFFRSMLVASISGIVLSALSGSTFLLMVGVFTFYMVFTGYRALKLKKLHRGQSAGMLDWTILAICSVFGLGLLGQGIFQVISRNGFGFVSIVFGAILLMRIISDYKRFTIDSGDKKQWLYVHIGNMMGAYIAAFTAFLVQNVSTDPAWVAWLAPTILITPFIFLTIRKFRKGKAEQLVVES